MLYSETTFKIHDTKTKEHTIIIKLWQTVKLMPLVTICVARIGYPGGAQLLQIGQNGLILHVFVSTPPGCARPFSTPWLRQWLHCAKIHVSIEHFYQIQNCLILTFVTKNEVNIEIDSKAFCHNKL